MAKITINAHEPDEATIIELLLEGASSYEVAKVTGLNHNRVQFLARKHGLRYERAHPDKRYGGRWVRDGFTALMAQPIETAEPDPDPVVEQYLDGDEDVQEALRAVEEATALITELRAKVETRDRRIVTLERERDDARQEVEKHISMLAKFREDMDGLRQDAAAYRTLKRQADEHKRRMAKNGLALATKGLWAVINDEK